MEIADFAVHFGRGEMISYRPLDLQHRSVRAGWLGGKGDHQRFGIAGEGHGLAGAEQADGRGIGGEGGVFAEGGHDDFAIMGPAENDGVQDVAFDGVAHVAGGEAGRGEFTEAEGFVAAGLGRALAENRPRPGAVDGLAVDAEPVSDLEQDFAGGLGDEAVGLRADVEQEHAVLADDVYEVGDEAAGFLEFVALDVSPGDVGDRGIGLPDQGPDLAEPGTLQVEHGGAVGERLVFVVEHGSLSPLGGAVVIVGREFAAIRLELRLLDPPVEPEHLGPIQVHQLARTRQPVLHVRLIGRRVLGLRRPVERLEARVAHVGVELAAAVDEPPMFRPVRRQPEGQALLPHRRRKLADHVAFGPHLRRGPLREPAIVHGEPVVMLGHRHHVARARLSKQLRPCARVEALGLEHRDEVLVAELARRPVLGQVMPVAGVAALIHHPRVPFAHERRHGVHAPMDEDAELRVLIPRRRPIRRQRFPRVAELPAHHRRIHPAQERRLGRGIIAHAGDGLGRAESPRCQRHRSRRARLDKRPSIHNPSRFDLIQGRALV
jgi:hypothetical protein